MKVLMMDGFNTYSLPEQIVGGGVWIDGVSAVVDVAGGRYSGNAIKLETLDYSYARLDGPELPDGWRYRAGFNCKHAPMVGTDQGSLFEVVAVDGFPHFRAVIRLNGALALEFGSFSAVWESSEPVFYTNADVWQSVEFCWVITAFGVGEIAVYINGALIVSMAMLDTNANSLTQQCCLLGDTVRITFDDFYVIGDPGTTLLGPLGYDCAVSTLLPNGAGSQAGFVGSVTDVDDPIGYHDGDSSFISATDVGTKSEFQLSNLPYTPTNVLGVNGVISARKGSEGDGDVKVYLVTPASPNGLPEVAQDTLTTAYSTHCGEVHMDDNLGSDWQASTINTLVVGAEVLV